jgi:hypothetical protein
VEIFFIAAVIVVGRILINMKIAKQMKEKEHNLPQGESIQSHKEKEEGSS